MAAPSPILRRRTSSHGETERRSSLLCEDGQEEGYRRRVVSFTHPSTSSSGGSCCTAPGRRPKSYHDHRPESLSTSVIQRCHALSSSGEDTPDGLARSPRKGEDVPDGVGLGGFRRRLKSLSIGVSSSSPCGSNQDLHAASEGGLVNSMVRRSLLQAAWPLSLSLENIEGHQKLMQQR